MSGLITCLPWQPAYALVAAYGLFGGGSNNAATYSTLSTWKYGFSNGVVANGTSLVNPHVQLPATFGNDVTGMFVSGYKPNPVALASDRYTFANDIRTTGASLTAMITYASSFSSLTIGVICRGFTGAAFVTTTSKYTYASNGFSAGTSFSGSAYNGPAVGNGEFGLSCDGNNVALQKYIINTGVISTSSSLQSTRTGSASMSAKEFGIIAFGNGGASYDKFMYADGTVIRTLTAAPAIVIGAGAGNKDVGVLVGDSTGNGNIGAGGTTLISTKMVFVDETMAASSTFSAAFPYLGGVSSAPAYF